MAGDLPHDLAAALAAGGRTDWGAAELDRVARAAGPPAHWPREVRAAIGMALAARFPAVVWFGGPTDWHRVSNEACHSLLGDRPALTLSVAGTYPAPGIEDALDSMPGAVLRSGSACSTTVQAPGVARGAVRHRTWRLTAGPVFAADGTVCAVFGTITDFDPTPTDDPTRTRALSGLRSTLDAARSKQDVAAAFLRCPEAVLAADAVSLGVIDADEGTLRIIFAGDIPAEQRDRYHAVAVDGPGPMAESVRTGRTVLVQHTAQGQEPHRPVLSDFARIIGTLVFNPLRDTAGMSIGALALGWTTPRSVSAAELEDLTVATALAGPALARVLAAERDHLIAAQLQDHLLDLDRSSVAAAIAATHRPATAGARVGGHWYLTAPGGTADRIALCVGEVVAHGLPAAAAMSRLRGTIVAAAASCDDPRRVLAAVDRHARTVRGAHGAAVGYAVLDTGRHTLDHLCAESPCPLVIRPDGGVQFLTGGHRPAVATSPTDDLADAATAELPAGALVVLYTAGLVEGQGAGSRTGRDRLAEAAAECAGLPVGAVCAHLLDRMAGPDGFPDEVAVLAVRPSGVTPTGFVQVIPALASRTVDVRHRLSAWLSPHCPDPAVLGEILISVGEALSNAVDHGSDPDLAHTVSVESFRHGGELTTTVSDCGRWTGDSSASRREAVRGRGLKLIHALSRRVETVRGPHGTRVTMHHALARDAAPDQMQGSGSHAHRR